jgi:Tfp pilus assembly protein PilN
MPTAKKEIKVNLLPQREFEKSTIGRILRWALSSFRLIVILTEMLVMAAFLSRFWLDAKNSDLNASIAQKKAVILSYATTEKSFRAVQKKLNTIAKITPITPTSSYLQTISSYLPPDIELRSVSENENNFQIVGASGSEQSIAQFIANLESAKIFKSVSLGGIDSDKDNQAMTIFTIKASL